MPDKKEHPIIMRAESVRAILTDRKTQTRRVADPQPRPELVVEGQPWTVYPGHDGRARAAQHSGQVLRCRYGVGDCLWVRESGWISETRFFAYAATPGVCKCSDGPHYIEAAPENYSTPAEFRRQGWKCTSSIHMRRWASRLSLEVTDIRFGRVQDITFGQIRAEGVRCPEHEFPGGFCCSECPDLRAAFATLWDGINAKRGFSFESNHYVWVIEFRKVERQ